MKKWRLLVLLVLLPLGLVWATVGEDLARRVVERLDGLPGFEAHYLARAASGRTIAIDVFYATPNKMRMELAELGAVTLFDGARYTYYDKERARAVVMEGDETLRELAAIQRAMSSIPWAGGTTESRLGAIYPRLNLLLKPDNLDLSLEMATKPHRHSWVRALADVAAPTVRGDVVSFTRPEQGRQVETTVSLANGLLKSIVVTDASEQLGSLRLQKVELRKPKDAVFQLTIPAGTAVRSQREDPSLMQQMLVTTFRSSLDYVLVAAKAKWNTLAETDKQVLRKAVRQCFDKIFGLTREQTLAQLRKDLSQTAQASRVRQAFRDANAKKRFAADHPELTGPALESAWRDQVVAESANAVLLELLQTVDQEIAVPIRRQVAEKLGGLDQDTRKAITLSVAEPIMQSFRDLVTPTVEQALRALLTE